MPLPCAGLDLEATVGRIPTDDVMHAARESRRRIGTGCSSKTVLLCGLRQVHLIVGHRGFGAPSLPFGLAVRTIRAG